MAGKHRRGMQREGEAKQEALAAEQRAQVQLNTAQARSSEIHYITETLRKIRERNHLGEAVKDLFLGGA